MNDSRSYITLDFRNNHVQPVVKSKKNDTARTIYIGLADGGTPYVIADGCYATFTAKKPDRTKIVNECTIENNMIVYAFTEQTCTCPGRTKAEIKLYGSNGRVLTSAGFVLEVYDTVFNDGDVSDSTSEMNALDQLIVDTRNLKSEMSDLMNDTGKLKADLEQKVESGFFRGEKGDPGDAPVRGEDYWTDDDKEKIIAEVIAREEIIKIRQDIDDLRSDMNYVAIDITSISNNVGTVEKGVPVSEMTVTWKLNKEPAKQTLGGENVAVSERSKTVSMDGRTSVSLVVTDERGATDSASTGYNSYNGVYYGVLEDGATIDSAAILSLTKKIQSNRATTFTVNPGSTQRIAFAIPTGYGEPTFKDAGTGFQADMTLVKENFAFINTHGYETTYNVWLSTNIIPGSITVAVT